MTVFAVTSGWIPFFSTSIPFRRAQDFPEYIESVLSVASQNPCADLSPKFCYNGRSLTYWRCRHVTPANHPQTQRG